jgi:hypothetical protein
MICDGYREEVDSKGKKHRTCNERTVNANVTVYTRAAGVTMAGSYKVLDVRTGAVRETQQLAGSSSFSTRWATSSGDQRALSREMRMLTATAEQGPPVAEEMVTQAGRDLLAKFATTLKAYAR